MSDLIEKLAAALDETEMWARAASQAYPYATDKTIPADGVSWEWAAGEDWEPVTPDPMTNEFVAPAGYNCWLVTKETWPTDSGRMMPRAYTHTVVEMDAAAAGHIIRHDPKHVLRQVAAHRKILELHSGSHECTSAEDNCVWIDGISGAICETVKIAAEAYGIEVE